MIKNVSASSLPLPFPHFSLSLFPFPLPPPPLPPSPSPPPFPLPSPLPPPLPFPSPLPLPSQLFPCRRLFAPPFVLSPHVPLASTGPVIGTQTHHILFNPEEAVLFCGYCVSPDQRWLLVACCDRQGELLDTSIIGIQHPECVCKCYV